LGFTGVILGALGAHALEQVLDSDKLASFNTGVDYQLYHALALLGLGALAGHWEAKRLKWVGNLWLIGTILFSVSIYLLTVLPAVGGPKLSFLGPITPVGGLLLIAGWVLLLIVALARK